MIRGEVRQNAAGRLQPWLAIDVETSDGTLYSREALIDTGFTGWLVLPESTIRQLGLVAIDKVEVVLATGEAQFIDCYFTGLLWQGELIPITVFQSQDQSLLGMQLLRDNVITIQAWDGGEVTIEEPTPES